MTTPMIKAKTKRKIIAALSALFIINFASSEHSFAEYRADTDTGANKLDIIENMRRIARENEPTESEKKLISEMQDMQSKLNKPFDPANPKEGEAVPTSFEGDDLIYDQITGEFIARGKVHIVRLDGHSFDAPGDDGEISGNTRRQEITIEGSSRVVQYPVGNDNVSRVVMDGYRTYYNYGTNMGTMANAKGKVDHQYITGKRFEFYPNRVVVYDGTATRCSAKKPDYHESAKKIIIWPNDRMYLYNVKVYIGNTLLYKKKYMEKDISPQAENPEYPRVGYSKDDGLWVKQRIDTPVAKRLNILTNFYANTKEGIRSNSELVYSQSHYSTKVAYGFYEDGDDNWIKRKPSFIAQYDNHMKGLPLSYNASYEIGHWQKVRAKNAPNIESTHTEYFFGLNHDLIVLPANYFLFTGVGYRITKETYDDSTNKGFSWGATIMKLFDDRWAGYMSYDYNHVNAENSLFDYNAADYSQRGEAGLSYRVTKNDRFVAGIGYDMKTRHLRDVDYYWFHDLHCSQLIFRYQPKKHKWHVDWQFLPW